MSNKVQDDIFFQREIVEPIDPIDHVAPVNVSRDITVGRKILAWARRLCRRQKDI
jgi:hypothetical protein